MGKKGKKTTQRRPGFIPRITKADRKRNRTKNYRERTLWGDVFLIKGKSKFQRKKIENERHVKYMDMMSTSCYVQSGFSTKPNPVAWAKKVMKLSGRDGALRRIEEIFKNHKYHIAHDEGLVYYGSKQAMKNITFYRNAYAYVKNNGVVA